MRIEHGLKTDLPRSWSVLGLVVLLLFQAGITTLWLYIDTRPPAWDRANHAERAFLCAEILASPSSDLLSRIPSISGFYPPLVHCVVGVAYLFAPVSEYTHQGVIFLFLAASLAGTYLLGCSLGGRALGLSAAGIMAAAPIIQVESKVFMLDIPLTTFVALSYLALLKSDGLTRFWPSLAAGIMTGLGLITKWSLLIYALPTFFVTVYFGWRRRRSTRPLAFAAMAGVVAIVVAGPWYLRNMIGIINALGGRAFKSGEWEGDPPVLSVGSALYYLVGILPQIGWVASGLFFIGLAFLLMKGPAGFALATQWAVPWIFFTLLRNKDLRYTLPLIPAVALVASYGLLHLRPRWRQVAVGAVVASSIWQVLASGFGLFSPGQARLFVDLPLLVTDHARREHWPIAEVLNLIARDSGGTPVSLTIVPDYPEFSRSNFRYAATLKHLPYRFGRAWDESPIGFEYAILKTGNQGPAFATGKARRIMEEISTGRASFERAFREIARFPLPTGDKAIVLKRDIQPIAADREQIVHRLKTSLGNSLSAYARNIDGLRIQITSGAQRLRSGRVDRLEISADKAEVGDFRRKPARLELTNIRVEFEGLLFNPHTLIEEGRFELLDLGAVRLRRASLAEHAIQSYIQSDPRLKGLEIVLESDMVRIEFRRGLLRAAAKISARSSNESLDIDVLWASLWGIHAPHAIVKSLMGGMDPRGRLEALPVKVRIGSVSIRDGRIEIDAGTSSPVTRWWSEGAESRVV